MVDEREHYGWRETISVFSNISGVITVVMLVAVFVTWLTSHPTLLAVGGSLLAVFAFLFMLGSALKSNNQSVESIGAHLPNKPGTRPLKQTQADFEKQEGHVKELERERDTLTNRLTEENDRHEAELNRKEDERLKFVDAVGQQDSAHRRELISQWRKMVSAAEKEYRAIQSSDDSPSFTRVLESQATYFSLKPHLSSETLKALSKEDDKEEIVLIQRGRSIEVDPPDKLVSMLIEDIARKEAEWNLI